MKSYAIVWFALDNIEASYIVPQNIKMEELVQVLSKYYKITLEDLNFGDPEFGYISCVEAAYSDFIQKSEYAGYFQSEYLLGLETTWDDMFQDINSGHQIKF